ncbi:hypothetical protein [Streptosporangium sp. NPDC049644]|uniref:hypothetical protein n=1 Tax=Streptosporangium sp. NPDC049644 TaxID=3155507 RepID=UPI00341B7FA2
MISVMRGPDRGSDLVHGDHIVWFEVPPVFEGQGKQSHRPALTWLQPITTFDPEAGDAEQGFILGREKDDVPHGPKHSAERYGAHAASVLGARKAEVGTVAGLTTSPFAPVGVPMKPNQASGTGQQAPELGPLRMRVAELFEKEEGRLPLVMFQVLQHVGHADAGFLGPDVDGTEPGSFQKRGILEVHGALFILSTGQLGSG